ncbi:hypothetical protein DYB32_000945 [Aphanomyces invadans]|uniref:Uncharacterized protein n=1 Tax=Aphanomyces invadans TaxID=157072 RepID=A0A418B8G9_9STRA|nr:hypothetical protein DYB32_000945 [Aphanomyces invadans]
MASQQRVDVPRYASVSEQLLEMSLNKPAQGKIDRHALEKRLVELQGDVSRLVSKLSTRAKDDSAVHDEEGSASHPSGKLTKARSLTITSKTKQTPQKHSTTSKSTIPGSRMGNLIRLQSDLHAANVANDQLRFDLDQLRKTVECHATKLREYSALQTSFQQLKAHCASLQQSLDLSETIRHRQKKIIHDLKAQATSKSGLSIHNDNQLDDAVNNVAVSPTPGAWSRYNSITAVDIPSPVKGQIHPLPPPIPAVATTRRVKKKTAKTKKSAKGLNTSAISHCKPGERSFLAPTQASQQRLADTKQLRQLHHRR